MRDDRFRYIRYRDGSEELYDHHNDPHEWYNLASLPRLQGVKNRLARHFPEVNAEEVPLVGADMNVFEDEAFE